MADTATDLSDFKSTPSYVASEIFNLRNGFAVLRGLLYDLRDMEGEITAETIYRILWAADHLKEELDEAYEHAEALADDERAAVVARRSSMVLQAAE